MKEVLCADPDEAKFGGESPCGWYDIEDDEWPYVGDEENENGDEENEGEDEDSESKGPVEEVEEDRSNDKDDKDGDSEDDAGGKDAPSTSSEEGKPSLPTPAAIRALAAQIKLVNKQLKARVKAEAEAEALAKADEERRLKTERG